MTIVKNSSLPSHVIGESTHMPRPLRRLPDLPASSDIRALRAAARKHLGMTERAAGAMSTIWVQPEILLPQVRQPRNMRIPGGNLLYIEGLAWTPRLMADPLNPRNAAEYSYPLAGAKGPALEQSLSTTIAAHTAELEMTAPSRGELLDVLTGTMRKTQISNTPYPPIGDQGIMDAPIGVMTVINFADGSPEIGVPQVREGSSRVCHAQALLGLEPDDTLLRMPSGAKAMSDFIAEINGLVGRPASTLTDGDRARVRCATTNFILIVGFEPDDKIDALDLAEAIRIKVAQEHLNTKQDWSENAQNSVIADDCLRSAFGSGLLAGGEEYGWLRGLMTSEDAEGKGLAKNPDDRFARLLWLFTTGDAQVHDAIRRPIAFVLQRDNGRKQIHVRKTTKVPYAVELVAREFRGRSGYTDSSVDRIVKVLENGSKIANTNTWNVNHSRSLQTLENAAQAEVRDSGKPGASCTELAVRALYYVAVHDIIRVPRHDKGEHSDRRTISDLLLDMLAYPRGISQLAHVIRDGRRGRPPILRDEAGAPVPGGDGQPIVLTNDYLRYELYPKGSRPDGGAGGGDPFLAAQIRLKSAVDDLWQAVGDVSEVRDDDDNRLIELQGLPAEANKWRKRLNEAAEHLAEWHTIGVGYRASRPDLPVSRALEEDEPTA